MAWSRTLLIILVLLNLLAFAALAGWLGQAAQKGEPERVTNQLNPERIKLRPATGPKKSEAARPKTPAVSDITPAPAVPPAGGADQAQGCVAFVSASMEAAKGVGEDLKARAGLVVTEVPGEAPTSWWVIVPPAPSRGEAEARVAELHQLGVTDLFIVQEPGANQFAISLALFKQEIQAQRLLERLKGLGAKDVRISPRGGTLRFEVRGPGARLAELSGDWEGRHPGIRRQACAP